MDTLVYTVLTILVVSGLLAALYFFCLISILWFGDICQICRFFKSAFKKWV